MAVRVVLPAVGARSCAVSSWTRTGMPSTNTPYAATAQNVKRHWPDLRATRCPFGARARGRRPAAYPVSTAPCSQGPATAPKPKPKCRKLSAAPTTWREHTPACDGAARGAAAPRPPARPRWK